MPDARPQHDFPVWPVAPALAVAMATGNYRAAALILITAAAEEIADTTYEQPQPQQTTQATTGRAAG